MRWAVLGSNSKDGKFVFGYETVKRTILGEDRVEVIYKVAGKHVTESDRSCIYAASFITCWARLKLHEQLHRLGHQVLYLDTDSSIYDSFPGGKEVKQGSILGEWTNEFDMKGVDYWITGLQYFPAHFKTPSHEIE